MLSAGRGVGKGNSEFLPASVSSQSREVKLMARYFRPILLIPIFLYAVAVLPLPGQSPQPQTYSVSAVGMGTVESMFTGKESTLKIFRNGPKELIDVTIAPWEANPKGVHTINLFDLQAHKVYMRNVTHNTCSWMRYVSADMPNYDPIAASAMAAGFAKQNSDATTEIVNGIPARIEAGSADRRFCGPRLFRRHYRHRPVFYRGVETPASFSFRFLYRRAPAQAAREIHPA